MFCFFHNCMWQSWFSEINFVLLFLIHQYGSPRTWLIFFNMCRCQHAKLCVFWSTCGSHRTCWVCDIIMSSWPNFSISFCGPHVFDMRACCRYTRRRLDRTHGGVFERTHRECPRAKIHTTPHTHNTNTTHHTTHNTCTHKKQHTYAQPSQRTRTPHHTRTQHSTFFQKKLWRLDCNFPAAVPFSIYYKNCNVCYLMQACCFRFYFLSVTTFFGKMVFDELNTTSPWCSWRVSRQTTGFAVSYRIAHASST